MSVKISIWMGGVHSRFSPQLGNFWQLLAVWDGRSIVFLEPVDIGRVLMTHDVAQNTFAMCIYAISTGFSRRLEKK